jgi:hypothetical protein
VLRPFGYLAIGLVWTAIAGVILLVGPGAFVVVAVVDGGLELGEIWSSLVADPSEMAAFFVSLPLLVLLWGPGVLWYLPSASWPLAVLSFVYVGRSLRPRYASEALSRTTWAGRGQTLGLPTVGGVALSLQPVRDTAATRVLMRFYVSGWRPDGRMFVAMLPAGAAWLVGLVGFSHDVASLTRVLLLAVFSALAGWSVVLGRRAWRRRFDETPVLDGVRVVDLSSDERRARMAELTRRRKRRQTPGR